MSEWYDVETIPKETDVILFRPGKPAIIGALFDGELLSFEEPDKPILGVTKWHLLPSLPTNTAV